MQGSQNACLLFFVLVVLALGWGRPACVCEYVHCVASVGCHAGKHVMKHMSMRAGVQRGRREGGRGL